MTKSVITIEKEFFEDNGIPMIRRIVKDDGITIIDDTSELKTCSTEWFLNDFDRRINSIKYPDDEGEKISKEYTPEEFEYRNPYRPYIFNPACTKGLKPYHEPHFYGTYTIEGCENDDDKPKIVNPSKLTFCRNKLVKISDETPFNRSKRNRP